MNSPRISEPRQRYQNETKWSLTVPKSISDQWGRSLRNSFNQNSSKSNFVEELVDHLSRMTGVIQSWLNLSDWWIGVITFRCFIREKGCGRDPVAIIEGNYHLPGLKWCACRRDRDRCWRGRAKGHGRWPPRWEPTNWSALWLLCQWLRLSAR